MITKKNRGLLYAGGMGLWFTIFFVAPLAIIIIFSFLKKGLYGGVVWEFSLDAYKGIFNPGYAKIFFRTLYISFLSTLFCLILSLPCGFAMARSRHQTMFLFLIVIPFWTNSLIRVFAWMSILGSDGIVVAFLNKIGFPVTGNLLYNTRSIILVSVYMYLPYAILPIFTAIDKFDFSLLEAARDLGATKMESMFKVLFPNIKSGIFTSLIFTFIPIFGAYTIPLLVGGKDSYMIGNIIVDQINKTRNWPLAAAFSTLITVICTFAVLYMTVIQQKEKRNKIAENGSEINR